LNTTLKKIHLKENSGSQKEDKSVWIFSQPRKPSDKALESYTFNWKFFSENFYQPSIFIENPEFLTTTLKSVLFNKELCDNIINYAKKYFSEKPKDKFQRKLVKYFLRLMITFSRSRSRDIQILWYLSDVVQFNKNSIKRGK
jgi:hypothetical protein